MPWLATEGPLAYTPEAPPDRDYYFQYGWVLPGIFADHTNTRRHYYFGAPFKEDARELFSFWQVCRDGGARRIAYCSGSIECDSVTAPVAVYHMDSSWRGPACLFIQHGSYQVVPLADQPLLSTEQVVLYRGVQESNAFSFLRLRGLDAGNRCAWRRYVGVQAHVLSDVTRSFNSIHDRTKRCETGHIRDQSWMSDGIAREHGLDIDGPGFEQALWRATHQSFSLARWVADRKFGPNYVVAKTPLSNIRMTTFFAGEHEVRVIDPDQVEMLEEHGCRVELEGG